MYVVEKGVLIKNWLNSRLLIINVWDTRLFCILQWMHDAHYQLCIKNVSLNNDYQHNCVLVEKKCVYLFQQLTEIYTILVYISLPLC